MTLPNVPIMKQKSMRVKINESDTFAIDWLTSHK